MSETKRNSFLEIFRFVFSFFILFYHGYFVVDTPVFCNTNYFVDFFFILSGIYFVYTIAKFQQFKAVEGALKLFWDRLKKLGIPLLISYAFVVASWFIKGSNIFALRYLWFVHILLIMYLVIYFLRALIKNEKIFNLIMVVTVVVCFVARFICLIKFGSDSFNTFTDNLYYMDEIRGVMCICFGILLRNVPAIAFKTKTRENIFMYSMLVICLACIGASIWISYQSILAKRIVEIIMDLVVFPMIIYLSKYIVFTSNVLNKLGYISIQVYVYQCIAMFIRKAGVESHIIQFSSIVLAILLTLLFDYRKEIAKIFKKKTPEKKQV